MQATEARRRIERIDAEWFVLASAPDRVKAQRAELVAFVQGNKDGIVGSVRGNRESLSSRFDGRAQSHTFVLRGVRT
jgi:hypothetical protein